MNQSNMNTIFSLFSKKVNQSNAASYIISLGAHKASAIHAWVYPLKFHSNNINCMKNIQHSAIIAEGVDFSLINSPTIFKVRLHNACPIGSKKQNMRSHSPPENQNHYLLLTSINRVIQCESI